MAEFTEVMRQKERMCEYFIKVKNSCYHCPLKVNIGACSHCPFSVVVTNRKSPEEMEQIIMAWAAEHPEPKYPSLDDWWRRTFPDAYEGSAPCWRYFVKDVDLIEFCVGDACEKCRKRPIPADIAEKLGIKPLEE